MTRCALLVIALWSSLASFAGAAAELSFDIVDEIGWRGEYAEQIPSAVTESYHYDPALDSVEVTVKFNRRGYCPVPPMLGVAIREGLPMNFIGGWPKTAHTKRDPSPRAWETALGPLMGFEDSDGYSYRIGRVSTLIDPVPSWPPAQSSPALRAELAREVEKILAAGHLRPWLVLVNVPGSGANARGDVYWDNPGEILAVLADTLPLLPTEMQGRMRAYLKTERETWPPESVGTLPYTVGTPREVNPLDPKTLGLWEEKLLSWRTKAAPGAWNLYGLARYYEAMGQKPTPEVMQRCTVLVKKQLEHRDWATLYWRRGHTPGFNAVHAVNQLYSGYLGYIRLARLAGDHEAEDLGWGLLIRMKELRYAMGKYAGFLHRSHQFDVHYADRPKGGETKPQSFVIQYQTDPTRYFLNGDPAWLAKAHAGNWIGELVSWNFTKAGDDVRQVERLDETGVEVSEWGGTDAGGSGQKRALGQEYWYKRLGAHLLPFRDMTPELWHMLSMHLNREAAAFCRRVDENQPHWPVAYAEAILSAEQGFMMPCDSQGLFLAHAWILHEPSEAMERLVDVPWLPRGDFFYLQKLVAALQQPRTAVRSQEAKPD